MSNNFKTSQTEPVHLLNNTGFNYLSQKLAQNQNTLRVKPPSQANHNPFNQQYGSIGRNHRIPMYPSTAFLPINNYQKNLENYLTRSAVISNSANNYPPLQQFCVRFAVNGLSKFTKGNNIPQQNRSIQAGDFGDDSGMIAENSNCIVIGLADGAGGNRNIGIDPKIFSRSLLGYSVEILKNENILPNQMAKLACKSIHILESKHIDGSGTLCLLALNKRNNFIHSLNIGDSGFRLIRNGSIVHKSKATMAGSSPKQLYVSESSNYSGISFVTEDEIRQDSDLGEFEAHKNDIIVLSSDGLYDVVSDNVIEQIVNSYDEKDLQSMADELLSKAMKSYVHTQRDDILIM
ncbi:unnamed protein product, partial [Brachionus calyciflorus]